MKKQLSVEQLSRKYRIDTPHADHVEQIAIRLIAALKTRCRFTADDARLLWAACRLHDVAPTAPGGDHATRGAAIVLREGIAGFTALERSIVAAAISAHTGPDPRRPPVTTSTCWSDRQRAFRLAAILRVADAFDHAHLQCVTIDEVKVSRKVATVRATALCCSDNRERVLHRADLWNRVLPVGLAVQIRDHHDPRLPFSGIVRPADAALDAIRRILSSQQAIMKSNVAGMIEDSDPIYLHDFRVAMRRYRTALNVFKSQLHGTGSASLSHDLAHLSNLLGPIRDAQVWVEFLNNKTTVRACQRDPDWGDYVERSHSAMLRQWRRLAPVCRSATFSRTMMRTQELCRRSLPDLSQKNQPQSFAECTGPLLWKTYCNVAEQAGNVYAMASDDLHDLRKLSRRARYLAEFASPILGGKVTELYRIVKRQASDLGTVHDVDVHVLQAPAHAPPHPASLCDYMLRLRKDSLDRVTEGLQRLRNKKFRRRLQDLLSTK